MVRGYSPASSSLSSVMSYKLVSRYVRPRLTTVRYPIVTMATQAAELALALADNRPLPEITNVFSPTLVRRHSVSTPSLEASHHATSD